MKGKVRKNKVLLIMIAAILTMGTIGAATSFYLRSNDQIEKQDNGFYTLYGGDRGQFDKQKTPVTNMVILLKILNGSNLCDNDWFKELRNYESMIKKQCVDNKKSKDKVMIAMLAKQKKVLDALAPISSLGKGKKVSDEDIETLRTTYNEYHEYYYSVYGEEKMKSE